MQIILSQFVSEAVTPSMLKLWPFELMKALSASVPVMTADGATVLLMIRMPQGSPFEKSLAYSQSTVLPVMVRLLLSREFLIRMPFSLTLT